METKNLGAQHTISDRMAFVVKASGGIKLAAKSMGVTEPALRSVVKGERNPGWKIIGSLAEMGIDLNWFINGESMDLQNSEGSAQTMVKKLTDRLLESERIRIEQELRITQLEEELRMANAHVEQGRAYDVISKNIKK